MKKIKLSLALMLLLGAVACKKTYNSSSLSPKLTANVSADEAADMVAGSISLSSNGLASTTDDATQMAASLVTSHAKCGTVRADTISRQNTTGTTTFSYNLTYNYVVNCNGSNQPDSLSSSLIYSGSFNGPNLSSSNSGSSIFTVSGLLPTATNFVINGEFKRNGSFKSKVDTTNVGSNNVDIVINALTLKKPSRSIVSGSATIAITGNVPKKGNFSFTGTLVFNGDGTATLTINGNVYTINLTTGQRNRM